MEDAKGNSFKIIFCGQLQAGHDATTAIPQIASFLKLSPDLVQMYFDGQQRFERDDLDFMTAIHFQRAFAKAGAVCLIIAMQTCASCHCRQKTSPLCIRCKKTLQTFSASTSSNPLLQNEQIAHEENSEAYQQKSRAIFWFSIGLSLQAGSLLLDQVLQYYGFDYLWLYFLSVPAFVLGGWYLAPLKGYPRSMALLCLFPLLGLGVMLLLPDRQYVDPTQKRHQQWAGAMMVVVSFIAFAQWGMEARTFANFKTHSTTLATMLKHQQIHDTALMDEQMTKFIQHGFDAIQESSSRPDTASVMVDELFYRLSDFFMCLHYQYYQSKHLTINNSEVMKPFYEKYYTMMWEQIEALDNPFIAAEFRRLLIPTESDEQLAFSRSIIDMLRHAQKHGRYHYLKKGHIPSNPEDFNPPLSSPYLTSIDITEDGIITMVFNHKYPEANGKTLIYALFPVIIPTKYHYKSTYTRLENIRVGGDLDDYYLSNFSIFKAWQFKLMDYEDYQSGEYQSF